MTIPKNVNPLYIYFKLNPFITTEINSEFLYRICIPDHIIANIPAPNLFTLEIYYDCPYHVFQWDQGTKRVEAFIIELQDSVLRFLCIQLKIIDETLSSDMNPKLHYSKHYIFWKIYRSPVMNWQEINRGMYNRLFISEIFSLVSFAKISRKSLYELSVFSPITIPAFKMCLNNKIYNKLFYNLFP